MQTNWPGNSFSLILQSKTVIPMKRLFSYKYSDNAISFALFILRLGLGGMMIPHGYKKLVNFASKSSTFADPIHIGSPLSMALSVFAEFFCAVFIILGLMTRLSTIPLIIGMGVVVFIIHKGKVFGEGEPATLFLIGFIALLFAGPGKFSMDRLLGK
jgi:putative oxidoreductase